MTSSYPDARQAALESLERGEAREAFGKFRWTMEYPGQLGDDPARWRDGLTVFARIAQELAAPDFVALVRRAAEAPQDGQSLFDLGYGLIDENLNGIAATVLARTHRLFPNQEPVLTELACALQRDLRFDEACRFLRAAPELIERSFACRYLLACNAVMCGDLVEPQRLLSGLDPGDEPNFTAMKHRITDILRRAHAVQGATPLDATDLRGWHFVLTGAMLLHLSPFGLMDEMRGRYAFTHDDPGRCVEGIRRMGHVLEAWSVRPGRVWLVPDPASASLGFAAAEVLGLPSEQWPADGTNEPGLIVVYDLSALDSELAGQLREHRQGQLLWAHASCWTTEPPFAPDLCTYLYQYNVSPWGERQRVNPDSGQTETLAADTRSPSQQASDIVAANLDAAALHDLPVLLGLAQAARQLMGEAGLGAFRTQGLRRPQPVGSPVLSNRFA